MRIRTGFLAAAITVLSWSAIWAGPIDNAQQFQQKAANSAMKKNYGVKPRKPAITAVQPQAGASKIINTENAGNAADTGITVDRADKKEAAK